MDDGWETTNFGSLSQTASGDYDSDGMTNIEEYTYGFNPTTNDAFEDKDGDRFPNVFELRGSSDPTSASSTPTPAYVVNGAGGGTHTTINAALTAANAATPAYPIIAIAPGTYSGSSNVHFQWAGSGKKYLIIGQQGAAKTIVDAGGSNWGWDFYDSAVIASLTIQHTWLAVYLNSLRWRCGSMTALFATTAEAAMPPAFTSTPHRSSSFRARPF
jgi:hypothetical protein